MACVVPAPRDASRSEFHTATSAADARLVRDEGRVRGAQVRRRVDEDRAALVRLVALEVARVNRRSIRESNGPAVGLHVLVEDRVADERGALDGDQLARVEVKIQGSAPLARLVDIVDEVGSVHLCMILLGARRGEESAPGWTRNEPV